MKRQRFFYCETCGNLVSVIDYSGMPMSCCGQEMSEVRSNTAEAYGEKHLPEVSVYGNTLKAKIGATPHPMEDKHYIEWVFLQTDRGCQRYNMHPGEQPIAVFKINGEQPVAVYAYCNIHGLWETDL